MRAPPPQVMQRMGEIIWLLRHSPGYQDADLDRVDALFLRPLMLDQLRVFRKEGHPVGLVAWALLGPEEEARYLADGLLHAEDWKSGVTFWFTDFLAPFGDVAALTRAACGFIPPGQVGYGTRRNPDGSVKRITRHRHIAG